MRRGMSAVVLATCYLAGAFPTADLVTRALGRDVHREGSGNPGATNTYRIAGAGPAALVATVDLTKGAMATWAGRRLERAHSDGWLGPACGVAAVLGHCFPPNNPAGGGKGVATTGGMLLVLDPSLALIAGAGWAGLVKGTRRASVASIAVALSMPVIAAALRRPRSEVAGLVAVGAVIVTRHRDNIVRLLRGQEALIE